VITIHQRHRRTDIPENIHRNTSLSKLHKMTFTTAHFHVTTAQYVINCTLKYALGIASDREAWKDMCEEGLAAFDINFDQEAEARRARRHTITSTPASGPRRHICGRICASEFGLRSHLRSHRPSVS